MKLLTQEIIKKLPALGSQDKVKDPIVVVKFFTPDSSFTWFIIEGEQEGEDWRFFANVVSHLCPYGELGYVMLSQLQKVRGSWSLSVERDKFFTPKPLSQCKMGT